MLYTAKPLDRDEKAVLERIEQLRREIGAYQSTRRWFGVLRRNTFARAIRGSNTIEGINVTVDDAMAAVEREEPLEAKTEAWAAIAGYRDAMTYVLQRAGDPHFSYSTELINSLHFMMLGYDLAHNPGRWRPGAVFVRNEQTDERVYEGPDAEIMPGLMIELIDSFNQDDDEPGIIRAAMAHLNLVLIHPFSDGNGRMARCLQSLMLARGWGSLNPVFLNIEEYLGRNTDDYYEVLANVGGGSWQPGRETKPWVRFCLTAHFRQATTLRRRAEYFRQLFDAAEAEVTGLGLNERMTVAVAEAAMGYRIRNATYRKGADVSDSLASRDLKSLVEADFLVPKGEKRGRFYVASPRTSTIADRVPRPQQAGDPFSLC